MEKDQNKNFWIKLQKILRLHNVYNVLKNIYFSIFPKGSKFYNFTYGFLRIFLKKIHLFNIYYQEWIRQNDTLDERKVSEINESIDMFEQKPHFSILMPVYNPPLKLLEEAIQSVLDQVYPYWELCIADDASTNKNVAALLKKYADLDPRIKVIFREENGHISAASNSALSLAKYDYLALLDHDDVLHPFALYYNAQIILEHPDSQIIYSDEDKITKHGRRLDAYFKPEFDYHLLLSHNMISHLGVYRTDTVRKVGGFRIGLEGSQDYDLLLRVYEQIQPDQIIHFPFPLYHWRITEESAADDINVKPYAIEAGKQAIKDHLTRNSIQGEVKFLPEVAGYQIDYELPEKKPTVAILILDQEISAQLKNCVASIIENTNYRYYSVIICLSLNTEISDLASINSNGKVKVKFFNENDFSSYAETLNEAVSNISDDYVMFLDRSAFINTKGWLANLVSQAIQKGVGAVGPKLLYNNEYIYSTGIILFPNGDIKHIFQSRENSDDGYFGWAKLTRSYSALSEKCLLVKLKFFNIVGGLTTSLQTPTITMVDFCLKLKNLNLRNISIPSVQIYLQKKYKYNSPPEYSAQQIDTDRLYLLENWENILTHDPSFNPNLTIIEDGKLLVKITSETDLVETD